MNMEGREFLLSVIVAAAVVTPALGQDVAPAAGAASASARSIASILDFSGTWAHPFLNGLEPPLSGPGPVRNRARGRGPQASASSIDQLVGEYTNPILQPWAAEVVKKLGERSLAGEAYPTPRNAVSAKANDRRRCERMAFPPHCGPLLVAALLFN
jgi:hypothetical protein